MDMTFSAYGAVHRRLYNVFDDGEGRFRFGTNHLGGCKPYQHQSHSDADWALFIQLV